MLVAALLDLEIRDIFKCLQAQGFVSNWNVNGEVLAPT